MNDLRTHLHLLLVKITQHQITGWTANDVLNRIWKEVVVAWFEFQFQHMQGCTEKNNGNPVTITDRRADILILDFTNTSQKFCQPYHDVRVRILRLLEFKQDETCHTSKRITQFYAVHSSLYLTCHTSKCITHFYTLHSSPCMRREDQQDATIMCLLRLNKTPTWCNKMQIFSTCFGRHAPIIRSVKYWYCSHRYRWLPCQFRP